MDKGFILAAFTVLSLGYLFFRLEKGRISSKEISIIAVLSVIAVLGRVFFAAVPGLQLPTFIVIISGLVFGSTMGFMVGASTALLSNMFLGQGPWTIFQMLAWGLCGISSGLLGKCPAKSNKTALLMFSFLWGYLFGWIMNLWHWLAFIEPLTLKSWLLVNASSLIVDTVHAVTNFLFMAILGTDFTKILGRFKKKLELSNTATRQLEL